MSGQSSFSFSTYIKEKNMFIIFGASAVGFLQGLQLTGAMAAVPIHGHRSVKVRSKAETKRLLKHFKDYQIILQVGPRLFELEIAKGLSLRK